MRPGPARPRRAPASPPGAFASQTRRPCSVPAGSGARALPRFSLEGGKTNDLRPEKPRSAGPFLPRDRETLALSFRLKPTQPRAGTARGHPEVWEVLSRAGPTPELVQGLEAAQSGGNREEVTQRGPLEDSGVQRPTAAPTSGRSRRFSSVWESRHHFAPVWV